MPNWQNEPGWPSPAELVTVNLQLVFDTQEPHALIKPDDLEAACDHPKNRWHYGDERDPVGLAVGLMLAVARAHPFLQGNKRTAFAAGQLLLVGAGLLLDVPDTEATAEMFLHVITGEMAEDVFKEAMRPFLTEFDLG